jgi:chromosome segregation ATPase
LEKVRSSATVSEERARASEDRALIEIDRERTRANTLKKQLEAYRTDSDSVATRHRSEVVALQEQIAELRQSVGLLEGNLQAEHTVKKETAAELSQLRTKLAELIAGASETRKDADYWKEKAIECLTDQTSKDGGRRLSIAGNRRRSPSSGKKSRRGNPG